MNNGSTSHDPHIKSIPDVIADLKAELQEFTRTRVAMLTAELREKVQTIKMAAPMLVVGLVVLWTAWLLLTGFLVAMIGAAFQPRPWAYAAALIIVAVAYLLMGGMALMYGWRRLTSQGLKPQRTMRILQQDKIWIQEESRAQL